MYYVYHIMENTYNGKYGIDDWLLCEQPDLTAAKAYGHNASKLLMTKYNSIVSKITAEARRESFLTGKNFEIALENLYDSLVSYVIYEVDSEQFPNETMMYRAFNERRKEFISKFCRRIA